VLYKFFFKNNKVFRLSIGDHIQWVLYITSRDHYYKTLQWFFSTVVLRVNSCSGEALYITYCDHCIINHCIGFKYRCVAYV
jgi:hypothetical protein